MPYPLRAALCAVCALLAVCCLSLADTARAATNKSAREPAAAVERQEFAYSGNARSKKYHNSACRYYDCKQCTLRFRSAQEARAKGFTACKVCGG